MVNEPEQRPDGEATEASDVEDAPVTPEDDDEEPEYQPPIDPAEVRNAVTGIATSFWDAVIQPTREIVRDGFSMAQDFARDLGGKPRRKK